jgi:predicted metalloprotease with PDZ domain
MRRAAGAALTLLAIAWAGARFDAQAPVRYRFSFPAPEHRWMQVEAAFEGLGAAPLELRMSRSSPGRYSLHDFAKNVYDVQARDAGGRVLEALRPDPYGWTYSDHGGAVTIRYKVFGDRVDGTYLAIDPTHAHINMPAAVMWARGLEDRPAALVFEPPAGREWRLATQLLPGGSPFELTAPNLQYLMDSPVEFGPGTLRTFTVGSHTFRVNVHHTGRDDDVDAFVADVEKIVGEHGEIFGEFPVYEPGHYTFLADYLPWAGGDGMEHRNSTVITSASALATSRRGLLGTVSHEFFHGWNVERIRPRSLEPFDFERANISGELWLAEGFTQYYGALVLSRAGLADLASTAGTLNGLISSIANNPAREIRSAVEMSRMAAFTDGGRTADRTNWGITVISYYPYGGAIALALDLTLRERSGGAVTLDDYMRAMWRVHGRPGGSRPGYVDRPYTLEDAEARLAEVSGDRSFAHDFFARYIYGHDAADYARLLEQAGLVLRPSAPGRASLGELRLDERGNSVRVASQPFIGSPAYNAGLDLDDELRELDGRPIHGYSDVAEVLGRHRPGDRVSVAFVNRLARPITSMLTLEEEGGLELVPVERAGGTLTDAQKAFRARWLN